MRMPLLGPGQARLQGFSGQLQQEIEQGEGSSRRGVQQGCAEQGRQQVVESRGVVGAPWGGERGHGGRLPGERGGAKQPNGAMPV
jgi:hypothetical protein